MKKIKSLLKKIKFVRFLYEKVHCLFLKKPRKIKRKNKSSIIQLTPNFALNDAIGNYISLLSDKLTTNKRNNYIVFEQFDRKIERKNLFLINDFEFREDDILVYHMSVGCDLSTIYNNVVVKRKIMIYHNITPPEFFKDNIGMQQLCINGREQLKLLRNCTDLAICDSKFNEKELIDLGYDKTIVAGCVFRHIDSSAFVNRHSNKDFTIFITTGRIARNKCLEDVIHVFYSYFKINNNSKLYIIGKKSDEKYYKELILIIEQYNIINNVIFTGVISDDELFNFYSNSDFYICMSEHEGFCVPLVEAMAYKLPICAINRCAIKETLGNSGLVFDSKDYDEIANKIHLILTNKNELYLVKQKEFERFAELNRKNPIDIVYQLISKDI